MKSIQSKSALSLIGRTGLYVLISIAIPFELCAQDFPIGAFVSDPADMSSSQLDDFNDTGLNLLHASRWSSPSASSGTSPFTDLMPPFNNKDFIALDILFSHFSGYAFASSHLEMENLDFFPVVGRGGVNGGRGPNVSEISEVDQNGNIVTGLKATFDPTAPVQFIADGLTIINGANSPWGNPLNSTSIYGCIDFDHDGVCTGSVGYLCSNFNYCTDEGHNVSELLIEDILGLQLSDLATDLYTYVAEIRYKVEGSSPEAKDILEIHACQGSSCSETDQTITVSSAGTGDQYQTDILEFTLRPQRHGSVGYSVIYKGNLSVTVDYLKVYTKALQNLDSTLDSKILDRLVELGILTSPDQIYNGAQEIYMGLVDEPVFSAFEPSRRVADVLRAAGLKSQSALNPGIGSTASSASQKYRLYLELVDPDILTTDLYPRIMESPIVSNPDFSGNWGIPSWAGDESYNDALNSHWDILTGKLKIAREESRSFGKDFWYIPPAFGVLGLDGSSLVYKVLRPPTGNELSAMAYLGLAFGAKGLLYFKYQSAGDLVPAVVSSEFIRDINEIDITIDIPSGIPGVDPVETTFSNVYVGFEDRWDKFLALNANISSIGEALINSDQQLTFKSTALPQYYLESSNENGSSSENIEIGLFDHIDHDFPQFMLVNRKTFDSAFRTLNMKFGEGSNGALPSHVKEVASGEILDVWSNGEFEVALDPGAGKLFRTEACNAAGVLTTAVPSDKVFAYEDEIFTSQITGSNSVEYRAGNSIHLKEGFHATPSASNHVLVQIRECADESSYAVPASPALSIGRPVSRESGAIENVLDNKERPVSEFYLGQNYPNPFKEFSVIPFNLPERSHVKVEVFSLLGESVAVITDRIFQAGRHELEFDGTPLTGGRYFYKVLAISKESGSVESKVRQLTHVK